MISFGLFPQASQPSMNFNISKLVYSAKRHATQLKTFKISNVDNQCKTMAVPWQVGLHYITDL